MQVHPGQMAGAPPYINDNPWNLPPGPPIDALPLPPHLPLKPDLNGYPQQLDPQLGVGAPQMGAPQMGGAPQMPPPFPDTFSPPEIPLNRTPPGWETAFQHLRRVQRKAKGASPNPDLILITDTVQEWVLPNLILTSCPIAQQTISSVLDPQSIALRPYMNRREFFFLCALLGQIAHQSPATAAEIVARLNADVDLFSPDFSRIFNPSSSSGLSEAIPRHMGEYMHDADGQAAGSISIEEVHDESKHVFTQSSSPRRAQMKPQSNDISVSADSSPGQPAAPMGGHYEPPQTWPIREQVHYHGNLSNPPTSNITTPYHPPPVENPPMPLVTVSQAAALNSTPSQYPFPPTPQKSESPEKHIVEYVPVEQSQPPPQEPAQSYSPSYWMSAVAQTGNDRNPFCEPPSPELPKAHPPPSQPQLTIPIPPVNLAHFGPNGSQGDPKLPVIDIAGERVDVQLSDIKEGFLFFQHHKYFVRAVKLGIKVVRRYSDFVWLLEGLHKKYPFRQIPQLPPKRIVINGTHITSDSEFLNRRTRGLTRFLNALVKHPVLAREPIVVKFLTVPSDLSTWRKYANNTLQDEFTGVFLDLSQHIDFPSESTLESFRSAVSQSLEQYTEMCRLIGKLEQRNNDISYDLGRFSRLIRSQTDLTPKAYHLYPVEISSLNRGLLSIADQFDNVGRCLVSEGERWDTDILEDLKFQRDGLLSMCELFDRRKKLDVSELPRLQKQVQANEHKLSQVRSKLVASGETTEAGAKPAEVEKLEEEIIRDRVAIDSQQNRHALILICLRDEMAHFHQTLFNVSQMYHRWASLRVCYAEMNVKIWKEMLVRTRLMPVLPPPS